MDKNSVDQTEIYERIQELERELELMRQEEEKQSEVEHDFYRTHLILE